MMKNREKTILLIGAIALVSMAVYCLYLSYRLAKNEALAEDLIAGLNENYDKLHDVAYSLEQLKEAFSAANRYASNPLYRSYTANATDVLHQNINQVIQEKSYHYGVKWIAHKTAFITPSLAFVEYDDGHSRYGALVQVLKTDDGYAFQELK